jgi:hypothetical protein
MDLALTVLSVVVALPAWLLHAVGVGGALWIRSWSPRAGSLAAVGFGLLLVLDVLLALVYTGLDVSSNVFGLQLAGPWTYRALAFAINLGVAVAVAALAVAANLDRSPDGPR